MESGRPQVSIGDDAISHLLRFCMETDRRRLLLVADGNTHAALGARVEKSLRDGGCDVKSIVLVSHEVRADAHHILRVLLACDRTDRTFLAVGSGTITDITRFVSHRTGSSFVVVPTAPSVDGFTSMGAPLIIEGIKTTAMAHAPLAIFADLDTLSSAPPRMIAAGFGDMLGKYTSVADWRLGSLLWGLPSNEGIAQRSLRAVQSCAEKVEAIAAATSPGVCILMEALIESGFCMLDFGSSVPASGTEHHYSHYWEMTLLRDGKPAILHGAKVGVATILAAGLYERIRQLSMSQVVDLLMRSRLPAREEEVKHIRAAYGPLSDDIIATQDPFLSMSEAEFQKLKSRIQDRWPEILKIAEQVPSPARLTELLATVGGPTDVRALGLTEYDKEMAESSSHYLRAHFTVRKLIGILFPRSAEPE
jgi:glycerol-1-phosphate dehydrogenase [NAD(P)+]